MPGWAAGIWAQDELTRNEKFAVIHNQLANVRNGMPPFEGYGDSDFICGLGRVPWPGLRRIGVRRLLPLLQGYTTVDYLRVMEDVTVAELGDILAVVAGRSGDGGAAAHPNAQVFAEVTVAGQWISDDHLVELAKWLPLTATRTLVIRREDMFESAATPAASKRDITAARLAQLVSAAAKTPSITSVTLANFHAVGVAAKAACAQGGHVAFTVGLITDDV